MPPHTIYKAPASHVTLSTARNTKSLSNSTISFYSVSVYSPAFALPPALSHLDDKMCTFNEVFSPSCHHMTRMELQGNGVKRCARYLTNRRDGNHDCKIEFVPWEDSPSELWWDHYAEHWDCGFCTLSQSPFMRPTVLSPLTIRDFALQTRYQGPPSEEKEHWLWVEFRYHARLSFIDQMCARREAFISMLNIWIEEEQDQGCHNILVDERIRVRSDLSLWKRWCNQVYQQREEGLMENPFMCQNPRCRYPGRICVCTL